LTLTLNSYTIRLVTEHKGSLFVRYSKESESYRVVSVRLLFCFNLGVSKDIYNVPYLEYLLKTI